MAEEVQDRSRSAKKTAGTTYSPHEKKKALNPVDPIP